MALEQIKLIKEAEAEAEAIRKKSTAEARQQVADGEKMASQLIEEAEAAADAKYREAMEKAKEEAENAYDVTTHRVEKECVGMIAEAERHLAEAASIIMERVVR